MRFKWYVYHEHLGSVPEVIVRATSETEAQEKAKNAGCTFYQCPHCGDTFWYLALSFATLKGAIAFADDNYTYVR